MSLWLFLTMTNRPTGTRHDMFCRFLWASSDETSDVSQLSQACTGTSYTWSTGCPAHVDPLHRFYGGGFRQAEHHA